MAWTAPFTSSCSPLLQKVWIVIGCPFASRCRAQQHEYQSRTIGTPMKLAHRCATAHLPLWLRYISMCLLAATTSAVAQDTSDLCDCARDAGLKAFDAGDPRPYPAGTVGCAAACATGTIVLPLPPDGTLRFSSFTAQ